MDPPTSQSEPVRIQCGTSAWFPDWLDQAGGSLALSTYQACPESSFWLRPGNEIPDPQSPLAGSAQSPIPAAPRGELAAALPVISNSIPDSGTQL